MFESRSYLLDIRHRTPTKRSVQELVDTLAAYRYNEFYLLKSVGTGPESVGTGPESVGTGSESVGTDPSLPLAAIKAYCDMQGLQFAALDEDAWERLFLGGETVTVETGAARSLAGRVEDMREKMIIAEKQGRERHLKRFLVTDLSDGYEWQPSCVSLPAIVMGGNFASSGARSANMDLERELNRVLEVPLAGLLLKLGTLYLRGGARKDGESEYFNILAGEVGYSRHPGLTQTILDEVSGIVRGIRVAAERWIDRSDRAAEIVYAANLLDAACHRRDETRLRELRDEHGRIWRLRHLPEGRVESLARLPRF